MWTCPKCGSKVDPSLDVCWSCGTTPEGIEDPSFVSADDAGPIDDPIQDREPSPLGAPADEFGVEPSTDIVECYQALSLMEAKFLADQLVGQGIPAVSDTQDLQDEIGGWSGNPHVYVRVEDLPRARAWLESYEANRKAEHGRGQ